MERLQVLGEPTDLYRRVDPRPCKRKVLLFFLPGNPGTLEFYHHFFDELFLKANSSSCSSITSGANTSVDVCGVGYAGHHLREDVERHNSANEKGLQYQIEHKAAAMKAIVEEYVKSNVEKYGEGLEIGIIGHSIGAYIAMEILEKDADLRYRTTFVCMLMPFLYWCRLPWWHKLQLNILRYTFPFSKLLITGTLQLLSSLLPSAWMPTVVERLVAAENCPTGKVRPFNDTFFSLLGHRLYSPRLAGNILTLGVDEFVEIPRQERRTERILQRWLIAEKDSSASTTSKRILDAAHSPLIQFIYTDNDMWAPENDYNHVKRLSEHNDKVKLHFFPGLRHAFSLLTRSVDLVSEVIVKDLLE